ncbi:MAG: Periplasmic heavy metal sensor [Bacteroidetes bacterium]|nr:Periplasmic heavy metal sensor [Bacteroidota bacterium]MBM2840842.1 Periplasmic heavy metal sensor [Bacteroidota bacterium]
MKKVSVAAVAVLLALSTFAFAQPPSERGQRDRMMDRRENLMHDLKLTDQQDSQVKKLHLDLERKQAQIQSKIRLAHLDLKEMYLSDKLDRSAIEKSVSQISDLQKQMKLNFVGFWFSVNEILTPEQQKAWKNHLGQMAGGMRERMRGRMQHGGPKMFDPPDDEEPR